MDIYFFPPFCSANKGARAEPGEEEAARGEHGAPAAGAEVSCSHLLLLWAERSGGRGEPLPLPPQHPRSRCKMTAAGA